MQQPPNLQVNSREFTDHKPTHHKIVDIRSSSPKPIHEQEISNLQIVNQEPIKIFVENPEDEPEIESFHLGQLNSIQNDGRQLNIITCSSQSFPSSHPDQDAPMTYAKVLRTPSPHSRSRSQNRSPSLANSPINKNIPETRPLIAKPIFCKPKELIDKHISGIQIQQKDSQSGFDISR